MCTYFFFLYVTLSDCFLRRPPGLLLLLMLCCCCIQGNYGSVVLCDDDDDDRNNKNNEPVLWTPCVCVVTKRYDMYRRPGNRLLLGRSFDFRFRAERNAEIIVRVTTRGYDEKRFLEFRVET